MFLCLVIAGCSAEEPTARSQPLPTLFPTPTPQYGDPGLALQVATEFLHHWETNDFEAMYSLLNFSSQDANSYEAFQNAYQNAYRVIRLDRLSYRILTESQENFRVVRYGYEVTFHSNIVGEFTDTNRELTLTLGESSQQWRIAWSPSNIFEGMAAGALVRFESFPPLRANIYDRNGQILADMNGFIVTVRVIPSQIPQYDACMGTLASALGNPEADIRTRMANYNFDQLAEIGTLEPASYQQWRSSLENDCRARFANRATRRYINGDLAPHILGHVGYPSAEEIPAVQADGFSQDAIIGRTGVEASWNETLGGKPGGRLTLVTPDGDLLRVLAESGPTPAQSVHLTLDADLQRFTLRTVAEGYAAAAESWGRTSNGASVIIMNVNTGEILAMVSYPTYNGNAFTTFPIMGREAANEIIRQVENDYREPLLYRPTQGQYTIGSTMKPFTTIAALESGTYNFEERYTSTGIWTRDIPRVDWIRGGHGSVNLMQAITHSCNSCFYEAGYRLNEVDPWILPDWLSRMGFGRSTGIIDVPEGVGLIGNPDNKPSYENTGVAWNFSDAVNIAIGQGGVQVTPLQLTRSFAAIANGGTLYRPQLVLKTGLLDEVSYQMTPDVMEQVDISEEILDYVRRGMCGVTTESYGTATHIFRFSPLQTLGVCGKTGTAQDPPRSPEHAWFVGFAPRENPEIVVVAMFENAGEGSAVAAPVVRKVLEYYFFGPEGVTQ